MSAAYKTGLSMSLSTQRQSVQPSVCDTRIQLQQMESAPIGSLMEVAIVCHWIRFLETTMMPGNQLKLGLLPPPLIVCQVSRSGITLKLN